MALSTNLPIYKDTYDLTLLVKRLVSNFRRSFRSHGVKLDEECLELALLIYRANVAHDKRPHLNQLLERLQVVNILLRQSHDLQLISRAQYAQAIKLTGEIGKQATGWRNASPAA
ncbi:four helix bundle protein [Paludibacterium purpuratum]|uniref:bAvd-like domain-containing protein n=1 Tax=Paludibacterium purpuratum TaxID=1144873 RepID=A0A4R7BDT9_9NEIS|nr:four helix bundle protein [Paludibacterium purpuratum]TDR82155.1 hypothetical protein DFP86_102269 [Paludibacterium purpuratum]